MQMSVVISEDTGKAINKSKGNFASQIKTIKPLCKIQILKKNPLS